MTMANALDKAGIDFVLLEARSIIDPQVGASIGLTAVSMRVFDQFGAAQAIMDQTTPLRTIKHHRKDGSLIIPASTAVEILEARFGYAVSFLDRQLVLRALADTIASEEKVLLNKRVKLIEHHDTGATVFCEDGTSYAVILSLAATASIAKSGTRCGALRDRLIQATSRKRNAQR